MGGGGSTVLAEDETGGTVKVFERFSCDYNSGVTTGTGSRSGNYYKVAGDLSPMVDPTDSGHGNVLAYCHYYYGLGLIPLGYDFKTTNKADNSISVQKGETYAVNFDYCVSGTIGSSDISIGLAIGKSDYTGDENYFGNGLSQGNFYTKTSLYTTEMVFEKNTEQNTGWKNHTAYITIGNDTDISEYNELLIYVMRGNGGWVYFDNITVKSIAGYKLLAEEDYNSSVITESYWDGLYGNNGNILIKSDPDNANNTVVHYHQSVGRVGIIRLGNSYKSRNDKTAITVEAGKTYIVDFDYKITGTSGGTGLEIGVAASKDAVDFTNGDTAINSFKPGNMFKKLITLSSVSELQNDGKFKHYTATISIPSDADLSEYNKLVLYIINGGTAGDYGVYIDNTAVYSGVTGSAYFEDKLLFESGYDTAVKKGGSRSDDFYITSGDLSPAAESGNEDNTVLYYRQGWYGLGLVVLGNDYTKNNDYSNAITVEKGISYAVTFDYKIFGATKDSQLNIGLAVGKPNYWQDGSINGDGIKQQSAVYKDFITVPQATEPDGVWHRGYTAYITVPENADLSTYNTLLLYARYGNQEGDSGVYFDNISVKALAGATAEYIMGDDSVSVYYPDGFIEDYQPDSTTGETAIWYYDSELTRPFDENSYTRTGKYETIPLYCKWDTVYKIKYYLNRYCAGKTVAADGIEITSRSEDTLAAPAELIEQYYGESYPTDDMSFDGWYTLKKVGSDYVFDKRVESVDDAVAGGCSLYAKWSYKTNTTKKYDINAAYSNYLIAGAFEIVSFDGEYRIKRTVDEFATSKSILMLADSDNADEGYASFITGEKYAKLNLGTAYKVSFKYKVTDVDPEAPIDIHLYSALISEYWADNYKTDLVDIALVDEATDDWVDVTTYFVADNLRMSPATESDNAVLRSAGSFADALCILTFGVGTIYFDDFEVIALSPESYSTVLNSDKVSFDIPAESNNGIVNVDGMGNFAYNRTEQTVEVDNGDLQPAIGSLKINGEMVYKNPDLVSGSFKGTDSGNKFSAPLGTDKASLSVTVKDYGDSDSGINFAVAAAEQSREGSLRFILRSYSEDSDHAFFNGKEYDIAERGVLLKRSQRSLTAASDMLYGAQGVTAVECENGIFNSTGYFSDYTVSINGLTEKYSNTYLLVRGYMLLTDGVNSFRVYTANVLGGSVKEISEGKAAETGLENITEGDITLAQSDISSVTLTFYQANSSGITYGFAWQTLREYENPVVELSENRSFENSDSAEAAVTAYTRYYKTDGVYDSSFSVNKEDSDSTYMTAFTVYSNKAQIGSLKPDTVYYYRVGEKGSYSMIGNFKTPDSNNDKFSFLLLSDTQQFYSEINEYGITAEQAFSGSSYDFVAINGDLVNYGSHEKQWTDLISGNRKYFSNIPVLPSAGNHEYNLSGKQASTPECLYSHFNINAEHISAEDGIKNSGKHTGIYYSYDYKNTHFAVLNTNEAYVYGYKLSDAQYNWLIADLTAANENESIKNIIVYMHNGIYITGEYGSNKDKNQLTMGLREQLQGVFAEYGVDIVLQAHDHIYSRTKPLDKDGNVTESGGVIYMASLPAGNQTARTLYNRDGDDYNTNIDKYESSVTTYGYDHGWTEISVNGNEITLSTYATNVNTKADRVLIDEFTVITD